MRVFGSCAISRSARHGAGKGGRGRLWTSLWVSRTHIRSLLSSARDRSGHIGWTLLATLSSDTWSNLPHLWICVKVVSTNADNGSFAFTSLHPLRSYHRNIHFNCLFPRRASTFSADKVRRINSYGVDEFGTDPVDCMGKGCFQIGWQYSWCNGDTG